MHVLIICNEYPPTKRVGGIGIFVKNFSTALVELGHVVTVIGLYNQPWDYEYVDDSGVRVIRISSAKFKFFKLGWYFNRKRLFKRITRVHQTNPVDIIETSDYEAGYFLMPDIEIPRVVRINGSEVYFRKLLREELKHKNRLIETSSLRKADSYAAVTNFAWEQTSMLFNLKQTRKYILPNFIDTDYFAPVENVRAVKGRIIYTGTFIRRKGVLELFECLNRVFGVLEEAHIYCVGPDSSDYQTGVASTRRLAMQSLQSDYHNRVTFIDWVPNTEVRNYLLTAEVCVYPLFLETQGIVLAEAMACEKAVISTNTGPGPEIIEDGTSGLLCHPKDHDTMSRHILAVLGSEELKRNLGIEARRRSVLMFSKQNVMPLNIRWYQDVLSQYRRHNAS